MLYDGCAQGMPSRTGTGCLLAMSILENLFVRSLVRINIYLAHDCYCFQSSMLMPYFLKYRNGLDDDKVN